MQILHVLEPDCHFARNIAVDDAFMPRRYRLIVFCVASLGGVARAQSIEPVAAYAFSEGSGTAIADVSENDNGGVLTTGASWTRGGRFGNGLVLAGGTQGVSVGGASALDVASGLTVEAWICPSSVAGYPKIAWRDGADGSPFNLAMAFGNGTLVFNVLTTAGRFSAFAYESLVANAWTHVAATYDGTALRVYLDGVLAGSMPASGAVVPSTGDLWLGRAPWGEGFTGGFDVQELRPDVFRVSFQGNGYTTRETVQVYWLYRCAQLAIEKGFNGFEILSDMQFSMRRPPADDRDRPRLSSSVASLRTSIPVSADEASQAAAWRPEGDLASRSVEPVRMARGGGAPIFIYTGGGAAIPKPAIEGDVHFLATPVVSAPLPGDSEPSWPWWRG